jgi:DNA-binding beta-propeller fold protein YncE
MLSGVSSSLNQPRDVFVDTGTDRLYVTNAGDNSILVFNNASTSNDPDIPDRVLNLTVSTSPWGIYVDDTPIVISSTASLDGFARSDGTASASGSPATGDKDSGYSLGVGWRQLYSFNIADIPASATIASAILRLYQCEVQGLPYTSLGNVIVDQMNYGDVFDPFGSAYSGGAVALNIGTLSTTASLGYRSLSVTARIQSDLSALRERSQYRLLFSTQDFDFDGNDDFVQFTDAEDSLCAGTTTNKPPQLAVTLDTNSQLYISGNSNSTLLSYNDANTVSGGTVANRFVAGGLTTLSTPRGIAVDMARNQIYVANFGNNTILVFDDARTVTGGVAPNRTITP